MLSLTLCVCKVSKINVKYVTCASAKRDDQNSAKLRVCFIRVYVFAFAATFNTVFCFFLANQTSFKHEFFPTVFFIDDQFFMYLSRLSAVFNTQQNALFCPTGFRIPGYKHKNNNLLFSLTPLVLYSFSPLPYSFIHLPAVFSPYFSPFPPLYSLSFRRMCWIDRMCSLSLLLPSHSCSLYPRPHLCNALSFFSLTHSLPSLLYFDSLILSLLSYLSVSLSLYLFIHLLLVHFLAGSSSYSLLLLENFLQFLLSLIPSKPVPVCLYFPVSYFHPFSSISLFCGQLS
jgi:hypothetical protein